jgi:hypothetical protein
VPIEAKIDNSGMDGVEQDVTKFQKIKSTDRYRIRSKTFIEGSNEYDKKGGDGDSVEYG